MDIIKDIATTLTMILGCLVLAWLVVELAVKVLNSVIKCFSCHWYCCCYIFHRKEIDQWLDKVYKDKTKPAEEEAGT